MRIAFVRHGSTDWNKRGRIQGQKDIPLDTEGRQQAEALGKRFAQEEWDVVYTSDLKRASETALIIGAKLGVPVILDERLKEISFGQVEGTTLAERIERWGAEWRELDLGIESTESCVRRGLDFLDEIERKHSEQNIIVVSHGAFLQDILEALLQEVQQGLHNTSVTIATKQLTGWKCELFNCIRHLEAD